MKKRFRAFFALFLVLALTGCSGSNYNEYYAQSETAIEIFQEAIELLDMCLEDKISAEECSEQLDIVAAKANDEISELAALSVSTAGTSIDNACLLFEMEEATMVDVQNAVEEAKQQLEERLYE